MISGDTEHPAGPYTSAFTLMREIAEMTSGTMSLAIAGYPEPHPHTSAAQHLATLLEKQALASSLVTQMCFSSQSILKYVSRIRHEGIHLPVIAGIPGHIETTRLLSLAAKIGVGPSLRFISRKGP